MPSHLLASLFLNHRPDVTRHFLMEVPYISMIFLGALPLQPECRTTSGTCAASVLWRTGGAMQCGHWVRTVTNKTCVTLDEKSLLFFSL